MAIRWSSQRWLFDKMLSQLGPIPFTAGSLERSLEAIGYDMVSEAKVLERPRSITQYRRALIKLASSREEKAREAEQRGYWVTARENYFAASLLYGSARWSLWEDSDELLRLNEKVVILYSNYIRYADHEIERIELPFDGKAIYGLLHKPKQGQVRLPCVVSIPGMDTFKEQMVRLYGDKLLEREMAVFAVDGPGQGESRAKGLKLGLDNYDKAGELIMDYLVSRGDIDPNKIAIKGVSFGSYWAPRIVARDNRYKACAVHAVCHEPEMKTLFNLAHPAFKARHMWMTGIYDERRFDELYSSKLSLEGLAERIRCPILIVAGEEDELSPIEHTYRFYSSLSCPKRLVVYEGEGHAISSPHYLDLLADFLKDCLDGKPIESGSIYVDRLGRVSKMANEGHA